MWQGYTPELSKIKKGEKKRMGEPDTWRMEEKRLPAEHHYHRLISLFTETGLPELPPGQTEQYAYKAAFLYRFTDYIEWENLDRSQTFDIAVLGKSPITPQMQTLAGSEKAKNKKMNVKEYASMDELGLPHILFISASNMIPMKNIIEKFSGKPVLIVTELGEREDAYEKGYINFFISGNKLKFEIRLKAVNNAGIKISSQLLQHAIIMEE